MKDRLFQNDDDEEQRYSADLGGADLGGEEETGTCTCRRAYSSERKLFNIPLARAFSLIVTIICFCGGVNFARYGLCTAGMKAIVGIALTVATIFTIYVLEGYTLTGTIVFTSLAWLSQMQWSLQTMPGLFNTYSAVMPTLERLTNFITDEFVNPAKS